MFAIYKENVIIPGISVWWGVVCFGFWAIGGYVHFHFYAITKAEAEEINEILKKRKL